MRGTPTLDWGLNLPRNRELESSIGIIISRLMLAFALITVLVLALVPLEQAPLTNWNDKLQHWLAFVAISGLVDASWPESHFNWKKMLFITVYGGLIEILQSFTGYRETSVLELFVDIVGALTYVAMTPVWKKIPIVNIRWALQPDTTNHTVEK